MTSTARRNVLPIRLGVRRVTAKTRDMSIRSRGNRESNPATIAPVTSGTSSITVFRVVKSHVETPQGRKRFDLSALRVRVTNRADGTRWICELLRVTTRARRVCSFARQCRLR